MASFCQQFQYFMGVMQRGRHQFRRLVAGVTEHDALVACALFLLFARSVHAGRNIGRLAMKEDHDLCRLPMEARLLVADVPDGLPGGGIDLGLGDRGGPPGLAGDHHVIRGREGLAGHAHRPGVKALIQRLAIEQIHDFVGYPVANLVRMALGNRFTGENEILARHLDRCPLYSAAALFGSVVNTGQADLPEGHRPVPTPWFPQ